MIQKLRDELDIMERHIEILQLVLKHQPIGIVALSNETGIAHHKVRYSLRILEEEDLIEPTERGAVPTERTQENLENYPGRIDEIIEKMRDMRIKDSSTV